LKTTYYLRTKAATHVEMSTVTKSRHNAVSSGGAVSALDAVAAQARAQLNEAPSTDVKFCGVDDPTCEACQ
jgi:ribonucleoside-diphosphate reductase alpha chain